MSEEPKKRGRKRTSNLYFGPDQEKAVVDFLTTESYSERNKIYNEYLRHPINKMIDSIIRRYKLYRKDYTFEDMHILKGIILSIKFIPSNDRVYHFIYWMSKIFVVNLISFTI